jgi:HEAT repeat protein
MRPRRSLILSGCLLLAIFAFGQDAAPDMALLKESKIPVDAPGLLTFFKDRTANLNDAGRVAKLIKMLGSDDFDEREDASRQLVALGSRVLKDLQDATKDPDVEVVRRAEECLRQIKQGSTVHVLQAAVRQLGRTKDPAAAGVLLGYLPTADQEGLADEVRETLTSLAVREGKADAAVVAALADKDPLRRAAAGAALARAKVADELPAVRKLMADSDAKVKARVALALASIREKAAVPVLISLLDDPGLNGVEVATIEDTLFRLGEDRSPLAVASSDATARKKYREAWEAWWKDHAEKIDLAKLEEATKILGCTTVVLLDQNKIIDLDATNKPRITLDNITFPLDVQYLPGDRFLIAENNGQRVTERNKEGKVIWEKAIESPLSAQRLPNGNTLIGTRTQLVEVDPKGKEVSTYNRPANELIMRVQRLRNGQTALVTQLGVTRFVLLDQSMKEIRSFGVEVRTSGGRIDVLPNGNVLIPENGNNRVVEHDQNGRVVWEVAIDQPIAAIRLPNGNTLVTSMNTSLGAVELDRTGKQVWQFKADTRVTRALRR